jgi:hypothetical protein
MELDENYDSGVDASTTTRRREAAISTAYLD